eukprot:7085071-Prymnesium_polylepis.1
MLCRAARRSIPGWCSSCTLRGAPAVAPWRAAAAAASRGRSHRTCAYTPCAAPSAGPRAAEDRPGNARSRAGRDGTRGWLAS